MRNCWKHDPSSRAKTREADLMEFSPAHLIGLPITSAPVRGSSLVETIGVIKESSEPSSEKDGWFTNVWDIKYALAGGIHTNKNKCFNVSGRVVNMSRADSFNASIFAQLRSARGDNIARFVGICDVVLPIATALIFSVRPTAELLLDYLRRKTLEWSRDKPTANEPFYLKDRSRVRFMSDIAKGLQCLHEQDIVHGDLRCANIVVENDIALLVDYGLPSSIRDRDDQSVPSRKQF